MHKYVCKSCLNYDIIWNELKSSTGISSEEICTYCEEVKLELIPFEELAEYILVVIKMRWKKAVEHLSWNGREGGYQGKTCNTDEILYDNLDLDNIKLWENLSRQVCNLADGETWCAESEVDITEFEINTNSWSNFCSISKFKSRFFLADKVVFRANDFYEQGWDMSIQDFLSKLFCLIVNHGLLEKIPSDTLLYRARKFLCNDSFTNLESSEFGPPPQDRSLQSNRMNPPGIPVMYASETQETAFKEVLPSEDEGHLVKVAQFEVLKDLQIINLDTNNIKPKIPDYWSSVANDEIEGISFLHDFATEITKPIKRDDRQTIEYIPTQIITEFFRDASNNGVKIDGIKYSSSFKNASNNLVLFIDNSQILYPNEIKANQILKFNGLV
jgi:hypothetical protein